MTGPVDVDRRMVTGEGWAVVADDEQHAAWLLVEHGARPMDPANFAWARVLTLTGARPVDPAVYLPGSML